jgi:NADPH:quinone reductase
MVEAMQAIVMSQSGDPEVLQLREVPTPEPAADQIRVRVRATALNRADLLQRKGGYPAPFGASEEILGLEFAGEVDSVGPLVEKLRPGDRVFGIVGGGSYAEYLLTTERMAVPIPANLDWIEAAAIPEVFMTAHDALFTQAGFVPGERVLVHAVGSGVGTAAVQLIRATGGTSFGTARSAEKLAAARELGLDVALSAEGWAQALARAAGAGVHVILDFVGSPYLADNLNALTVRGRLLLIGLMGGAKAEIDLGLLLRKRLHVVGTVLRARPLEEKIAVTQAFARQVVPLLERGSVRPIVDRVFDLKDAAEAHRYMEANANFGKIVLRVG